MQQFLGIFDKKNRMATITIRHPEKATTHYLLRLPSRLLQADRGMMLTYIRI